MINCSAGVQLILANGIIACKQQIKYTSQIYLNIF